MNTLIFSDFDGSMRVEYKVDLLDSQDNYTKFTVMEVTGEDDAEIAAGLNFRQLQYSVPEFKAFAIANYLKLERIKSDGTVEVIVNATDHSPSIPW